MATTTSTPETARVATLDVEREPLTDQVKWGVLDTMTVVKRDLLHLIRLPDQLFGSVIFAVVSVLLFGFVFGSAIQVPGGGDYREFLMPGLFGMTVMYGIAGTAAAMLNDRTKGVTDRFRAIPMSSSAVVAGRSVADLIAAMVDLTMLILCGLVVGWQWNNSIWEALAAIGLLMLLRFALIWAGVYLGLVLRTVESVAVIGGLLMPVSMISNAFVAPELMPAWLRPIAEWNPLSATVTAIRDLFGNPGVAGASGWPAENALLLAVLWPLALIAIFFPLSVRRYRRLSQ